MKYLVPLSLCALLSLLGGCKSNPTSNTYSTKQYPAIQTVTKHSIYPEWVNSPNAKGYLSVVGSAKPQKSKNPRAQYRVALLTARAELSRIYNTHIENQISTSSTQTGNYSDHQTKHFTKLKSSGALQLSDAVVLKEWTHPDTKELFLWLALPLK